MPKNRCQKLHRGWVLFGLLCLEIQPGITRRGNKIPKFWSGPSLTHHTAAMWHPVSPNGCTDRGWVFAFHPTDSKVTSVRWCPVCSGRPPYCVWNSSSASSIFYLFMYQLFLIISIFSTFFCPLRTIWLICVASVTAYFVSTQTKVHRASLYVTFIWGNVLCFPFDRQ